MPGSGVKKIVGLTGGIGAGKSVIGLIFKDLGFPLFDSDEWGKKLLTENTNVVKKITEAFSSEVLDTTGKPDRKKLAQLVFNNSENLKKLNAIIHPEVNRAFHTWMAAQNHPVVIRESALLFETGFYKESSLNILVTCPEEIRIARVMKRNGITREDVQQRMKNQMPETEKQQLTDLVIVNDDEQPVLPQVWKIIERL